MDETGWKVDAQLRWLWGVVTEQITCCQILPGRGFAQAASILGAGYTGWLIHDGLQVVLQVSEGGPFEVVPGA
jgi:hypothetical protein